MALGMWTLAPYLLDFKAEQTGNKRLPKTYTLVRAFLFWILPVIEIFFVWKINQSIGLVVTFGILWYLALGRFGYCQKLYQEKINIDRITGNSEPCVVVCCIP